MLVFGLVWLAVSRGHAAESGRAERCERLATRGGEVEPGRLPIVLFGIADDRAAVAGYFRRHRLAVTAVDGDLTRGTDGWKAELSYPSFNSGGEGGGSTVLYPHTATILIDGDSGADPTELDLRRVWLVLEVEDADRFLYRWVGCAVPSGDPGLDWFAGWPELLFEPTEESVVNRASGVPIDSGSDGA